MYVAVKGGERAIGNAHRLYAEARRGDPAVPELTLEQIGQQLSHAVDRVMTEGGLYDPFLAALAIKQARGDLVEAIFLLRAYRTTLPRFGAARPLETDAMAVSRRISATFKDLPGGQMLGPTADYSHRLLDFALAETGLPPEPVPPVAGVSESSCPRVTGLLAATGLVEAPPPDSDEADTTDLTRTPLALPAGRALRLQALARGDEGFLLALGYSTQRGFGTTHPFAAEIRMGSVEIELEAEELGFPVVIGEIAVTECQMINQFQGTADQPPQFTSGYGLAFGEAERKAMAMALVDRALRWRELSGGDDARTPAAPAEDEEFVLAHADAVEASGFVQHLKLPHYVDFQAELELLRRLRADAGAVGCADGRAAGAEAPESVP